ncbi:hypothetical protein CAEBREN_24200 [Caenorhabditis brenneri]|uniref:Nuclear receptor domain-containing protein n=1 Tax=Caenorhabditis brenneri TaxID=135651 RepID=G0M908_CAEBE|nr:hypothetical protein CAEBREN_24200 [Caenorhabditis brenneri]
MCLVCGLSCRTHFHFGGASCTACASFFRRTVSLNIRYVCKRENDCISSPELRSICRACRYECCINKAGMNRELVQQRRNDKRIPKYVLNSRNGGSGEIVRDYTTNSYTTLHEFPQVEPIMITPPESIASEDSEEFSKILDVSHMALLDFYVKQVEMAKDVKNTLLAKSIPELLETIKIQNELAIDACTICPGADILDREDVEVLLKYFQFANIWMDSLWAHSVRNGLKSSGNLDGPLPQFIHQVKSIGSSLAHLTLNIYEFAALKSFCIWKLGIHDTTISIKIVAQEQYLGVTSALRKYYEVCRSTITPMFSIYHEMVQFYQKVGIPTVPVIEE